jgi:pimeloyl-ACP methyl ester carboxylesterase
MKKKILKSSALALVFAIVVSFAAIAAAEPAEKPFENSQFFTSGDYSIHYRVFEAQGEQKGRILFLHGFLVNTYSWENMTAEMTKAGYTCVLADLPNFGYSSRENADTTVIPREDLMISLMESMAPLNTWYIAGHSMGGGVAMNIAIEHPDIMGLLLYCPAPNTSFPQLLKPVVTSKLMGSVYTAFFKFAAFAPKIIARLAVGYIAVDLKFGLKYDIANVTDPLQIEGSGPGMTYMTANTTPTDMTALPNLQMPILLVEGEKDNTLPKSMIEETIAALPQATLYIVPGGGHMSNENKAVELAAVTVDFLEN